MEFNKLIIKKAVYDIIETEILYEVASTRARGLKFLEIGIDAAEDEKAHITAIKVLKKLKKQGKIELFITVSENESDSKEAQYVSNKYPELSLSNNSDERKIIVMI